MARPKREVPRIAVFLNLDPLNPLDRKTLHFANEIATEQGVFSEGKPYLRYGIEELLREAVAHRLARLGAGPSTDLARAYIQEPVLPVPEPAPVSTVKAAASPLPVQAKEFDSVELSPRSLPEDVDTSFAAKREADFLDGGGTSRTKPDTGWLDDLVDSHPVPGDITPAKKDAPRKPAAMLLNLGVNTKTDAT